MSEIKVNSVVNSTGDNDSGLDLSTNDQVIIKTANTTAITVDSSQNVTNAGNLTVSGAFTSQGIDDNADAVAITIDSSERVGIGTSSPSTTLHLDSGGTPTTIQIDSDTEASIEFNDHGGSAKRYKIGTNISSNDGQLEFKDMTANAERIRIDSSGNLLVGTTTNGTTADGTVIRASGEVLITRTNGQPLLLNRAGNDGTLIEFRQANSAEGSISVSGTTVSYNGGHLSRWSRLLDNSKDTSIVKGTVMTNLDEMVEWGDEDNEQLNKMAVSSVEGDANVAGVFVNWDNDDDWNDMNIAMTGDMVIRIAQGTTVARGDLLMSAGDGTAKPQGDDIIRSKTIAKVTSTNVSHTYDDGSYLVPCVLMAC